MSRKLLSFVLTAAMVASIAAIAAPAAQAQIQSGGSTSAQMFNPDVQAQDSSGNPLTLDLSSKPDGTDSTAHITSVATGDVTEANYYYCPNTGTGHVAGSAGAQTPPTGNGNFINPANNGGNGGFNSNCQFIGSDTTGTSAGKDTDEKSFEFNWAVPGGAPRSVQIVALHCVGAPTATEPGTNCVENLQNNVNLDSSGLDTSGEFVSWCVSNTSTCPSGSGVNNFTAGGNQTISQSFKHPTLLPVNAGAQHYILTATGSTDIATMTACWDDTFVTGPGADPSAGADATGPPNECTALQVSNGGATTANGGRTFTFDFSTLNPAAGIEDAFYIYNSSGGSGACQTTGAAGDGPGTAGVTGRGCLLDAHYVVFEAPRATSIIHTFQPNNSNSGSGNSSNVPNTASCTNPVTTATDNAGDSEDTLACAVDQFGRPFSTPMVFESRGVGTLTACATGSNPNSTSTLNTTPAPTNSGVANSPVPSPTTGYPNQICRTTTATTASARFRTNAPGTQSITACADLNSNRFCDDSEPATTIVKTHQVGPARALRVAWQGTGVSSGTGNLNDCRTGTSFKNNFVGDTDTFVICSFDSTVGNTSPPNDMSHPYPGNPATTTDTHLDYQIVGNPGVGAGVSFASAPPSGTGADGTTTAQIHADAPSSNTISVILRRNSDNFALNTVTLTKDVRQNPTQPASTTPTNPSSSSPPQTRNVATNLTIRFNKKAGTWKGAAGSSEAACQTNRHVTLWKARRHHHGKKFIGDYTTGNNGNWHVVTGQLFGKFFATVDAANGRTDSQGLPINCLSDKSVTILRKRH